MAPQWNAEQVGVQGVGLQRAPMITCTWRSVSMRCACASCRMWN